MSWFDPGGIGKWVMNPGGINDWMMPYVAPVSSVAGGIIGGYFGGPGGAAAGSSIGAGAGNQLGRYLSTKDEYHRDPFSGEVLKESLAKSAIGAGAGYAGATLGGFGGGGYAGGGEGVGSGVDTSALISEGGGFGTGVTAPSEVSMSPYLATTANQTGQINPNTSSIVEQGGSQYPNVGPEFTGSEQMPAGATKNGGFMNTLGGIADRKNLPYLMLAGSLLNYAGEKQNLKAQQEGQQQFRNDTTWTPERSQQYMTNLNSLVSGLYAGDEANKRKTVAGMMSEAGRGGGTYGSAAERIARERREAVAKALTGGLLTTSTPPNTPMGAYTYTSPGGNALTNTGGLMGNMANYAMLAQLLSKNSMATA